MNWPVLCAFLFGSLTAIGIDVLVRYWLRPKLSENEVLAAAVDIASKWTIAYGAPRAAQEIEATYAETIAKFNDEQRAHLEQLRSDPVSLAKWLTRISRE